MKNIMIKHVIFLFLLIGMVSANAQTLGGYPINDYLINAVHPNGCNDDHVTGLPDELIWVNFDADDLMTGNFGQSWTDVLGDELLLETGFHEDNYSVRLLLSSGLYSSYYNTISSEWIQIEDVTWQYLFTSCDENSLAAERYILPLDFDQDFGLNSSDTVTGIEITFLTTSGSPDLSGVYIVEPILENEDFDFQKSVTIYPVPMTQNTRVHIDSRANFESLEIIDITGRLIQFVNIKNINLLMLDQFNFKNGIYFLRFNNENFSMTKKIVVNQS